VMVSGSEGETLKSKIDPCGMCGKSFGKIVVVHKVPNVDSWKMCKDEEVETQHGKTFRLWKLQERKGRDGGASRGVM